MRKIYVFLSAIVLTISLCLPIHAEIKFDMAVTYSGQHPHAETCREFAKRVNETLKGQVFITVHEGGALGLKDADRFTATGDGIVPIQSILMGAAIGTSPVYGLSTCPFYVRSFKEGRLLEKIARPYYDKEASRYNQIILYTDPWPPSSIHTKRPIKEYSDLKGLRIRTYDKNGTDVLKRSGANPVVMSWGDVYPALATNTIDSVLTASLSVVSGKFWEVLSHTTRVYWGVPLSMINMNLDAFNKLSEKQQKIIIEIGKQMEERQWELTEKSLYSDEATCEKNGMTVIRTISDEFSNQLASDAKFVIDDWAKKVGSDAKNIMEEFEKKRGDL